MSHALRRETLGKFITRRKRIPLPDLSHLRPANDDLSRLCIKFQMVKKHTLMDLSSASCLALVVNYVLSREKKCKWSCWHVSRWLAKLCKSHGTNNSIESHLTSSALDLA